MQRRFLPYTPVMISLGIKLHHKTFRYALVHHTRRGWHCLEAGNVNNSAALLNQLAKKARRIILGISASEVLTKVLSTPASQHYWDVVRHIEQHMERLFGQPAHTLAFDFFPLRHTPQASRWQIVATRKSILSDYQKSIPGLALTAIDVDTLALLRMSRFLLGRKVSTFVFAFRKPTEVLLMSVKDHEQQRCLVIKKHITDTVEKDWLLHQIQPLQLNAAPIFLSGLFDQGDAAFAKIVNLKTYPDYLDCIGLALWNTH